MKDLYGFAGSNPWLFLAALLTVVALVNAILVRPWRLWLRHRNIVAKGWPPAHLDADGDSVTDER